jgi:hypothetical protein
MSEALYRSVGGKMVAMGTNGASASEGYWDFGWRPPEVRTEREHEAHDRIVSAMPRFSIQGRSREGDSKKVNLTELWNHSAVVARLGYAYSGTHQLTGSCFKPGTRVRLADGSEKPIEEFKGGEKVITHAGRVRKVIRPTSRTYSGAMRTVEAVGHEFVEVRRKVTATADHRFFTPAGDWKEIGTLKECTGVMLGSMACPVDRLSEASVSGQTVHCLEVEEDHSFIANGFVVANCVGAGGGNVAASLSFVEVIRLGDPEQVILPFYPFTYGRSRFHSGSRGRGEGSSGSGWAQAAIEDGILDNLSHEQLPKPKNSDGLIWGADVEMAWSDGAGSLCTGVLELGRKHLIRTASRMRSADDCKAAISNLFPITCASMYGFKPEIRNGVLFGVKGPRWAHQMALLAVWEHPELGDIFWLQNQWGDVHGRCPTGMPFGGVWIPRVDVDWMCRDEVFAFSQYNGYPAPDFDVSLVFG